MPRTLPLHFRGDPVLARRAAEVKSLADPVFQAFIEDLIHSGEEHQGVGIAAPQVGRPLRLFILAPKPNPRYPDAPALPPQAVINPRIVRFHGPVEKDWEGCLSVPGFRGLVPRARFVDVVFLDRFGREISAAYEGFPARVFQHEYDHLEGVLYPERMAPQDRLLTLEEFAATTGLDDVAR